MKRPAFIRHLFLLCILVLLGQYAFFTLLLPQYAIRALQTLAGGRLSVDRARVSSLLITQFTGLHLKSDFIGSALSVQQIIVHPNRFWMAPRLLEIEAVDVDRPFIRFSRTSEGTVVWPWAVPGLNSRHGEAARAKGRLARLIKEIRARCAFEISTLRITNGTIEFFDDHPATPFHIALEHATVSLGPILIPDKGQTISFAARGLLTGFEGNSAPAYCSGWVAASRGDMDVSCQLEPLALAIFNAYFQERPVIRVYSATLASTSRWTAKGNQLDGQIHFEIDHLDEGDISVRGHEIFNIKRIAKEGERRLVSSIHLTGRWDHVGSWQGEFIAGNEPAQKFIDQLLERQIKTLRMPVGSSLLALHLAPATEAAMQGAEATSKSVAEALELLAEPPVIPEREKASQPPTPDSGVALTPPAQTPPPAAQSNEKPPASAVPSAGNTVSF